MDQTGDMRDATHEDIMKKAKAKFDLLVNSGKWGAKSPDQEKIIALEAQLKQLKDLKLSAQLIKKLKQDTKGGQTPQQTQDQSKSQGQTPNQRKNRKDRTNKRMQKQDEEWKKIPPKDNESKQKQVGKKIFHWCEHHMKWTIHKPDDCEVGKRNQANQGNKTSQGGQNTANQATYAELMAQLALHAMDQQE
jgi:hypothetical protein